MNVSFNDTASDVWLRDVIYHVRMCFLPIIFVGTVTNILNFMVLSKREMRCLSTSVYLSALAVADLGIMYFELFRVWFEWMDILSPELYFTDVYCKLVNYSNGVIRDFSNWLIACLALERVVMVASPYNAKRLCTIKTAKTITLSLLGIICVPHCVYLVFSTAQFRTHWVCWEDPSQPISSILVAIVELFVGYTVVLVVFVLNIVLVSLLYKNDIPCISVDSPHSCKSSTKRVNNNRRLTRTLLSIAFVFILCETPRIIMSIICRFLERTPERRIILNLSFLLSGFNHASNFIIYIFASPRFRLILYKIIPLCNLQGIHFGQLCGVRFGSSGSGSKSSGEEEALNPPIQNTALPLQPHNVTAVMLPEDDEESTHFTMPSPTCLHHEVQSAN